MILCRITAKWRIMYFLNHLSIFEVLLENTTQVHTVLSFWDGPDIYFFADRRVISFMDKSTMWSSSKTHFRVSPDLYEANFLPKCGRAELIGSITVICYFL